VRARDLGIVIGAGTPGPLNAITDVAGVLVGHTTLISGAGPLVVGRGPVRTGVTVIRPHEGVVAEEPLFAGFHRTNGAGEITGIQWLIECGQLVSPIAFTNTHSVGAVHEALIALEARDRRPGHIFWSVPVVTETFDGYLNDINGFHVRPEHATAAHDGAKGGPVEEGSVGGGTGMMSFALKAGIGSASRVLPAEVGGFTVGVLVQANFGRREEFVVNGAPIGQLLTDDEIPKPRIPEFGPSGRPPDPSGAAGGSCVAVVATDAPLLPQQLAAVAQRLGLGLARLGNSADHWSGDLFVAFSTAHRGLLPAGNRTAARSLVTSLPMLSDHFLDPIFTATVEAMEEAIVNSMLQSATMVGRDDVTVHGLPAHRLVEILERYDRLSFPVG
jgi:D-aminopeptidase